MIPNSSPFDGIHQFLEEKTNIIRSFNEGFAETLLVKWNGKTYEKLNATDESSEIVKWFADKWKNTVSDEMKTLGDLTWRKTLGIKTKDNLEPLEAIYKEVEEKLQALNIYDFDEEQQIAIDTDLTNLQEQVNKLVTDGLKSFSKINDQLTAEEPDSKLMSFWKGTSSKETLERNTSNAAQISDISINYAKLNVKLNEIKLNVVNLEEILEQINNSSIEDLKIIYLVAKTKASPEIDNEEKKLFKDLIKDQEAIFAKNPELKIDIEEFLKDKPYTFIDKVVDVAERRIIADKLVNLRK